MKPTIAVAASTIISSKLFPSLRGNTVNGLLLLLMLWLPASAFSDQSASQLQEMDEIFFLLENGSSVPYREQLEKLEYLGTLLPDDEPALRRRYDALSCWMTHDDEEPSVAVAFANDKLASFEFELDPRVAIELTTCRGYFHWIDADPEAAIADFKFSMAEANKRSFTREEADATGLLGDLLAYQGKLGNALDLQLKTEQLYEQAGNEYFSQMNRQGIANTYRRMHDFDMAMQYLRQVEAYYQRVGDDEVLWQVRSSIGLVMEDLNRPEEALELYQGAIAFYLLTDEEDYAAYERVNAASALNRLGRYEEALQQLQQAKDAPYVVADVGSKALVQLLEGQSLNGLHRYQEALQKLALAEDGIRQEKSERYLAWLLLARAEAEQALGLWQQSTDTLLAYIANRDALDKHLRQQQSIRTRVEFDVANKDAENLRLKAERDLQQQQLRASNERRRWLGTVIALSAVLVLILVWIAYRQIRHARRMKLLALTDELTGLANRRQIMLQGNLMIEEARRQQQSFSLLVFDVDYFKRINDTFGHEGGDEVLRQLTPASLSALRSTDKLGRTGGEEFMAVLPNTNLSAAVNVAERLRRRIEEMDLDAIEPGFKMTVSIGVAELNALDKDLSALTQRADDALYRAKDLGRNRVEVSG